jgi:hypothetical protein
MEEILFNDLDCVRLATPDIELIASISVGPRILSLALPNEENVLAELPDLSIPTDLGGYNLRGGHRMWHAPEHMPRSYQPDDGPVDASETEEGLQLSQVVEERTGMQKTLVIQLDSAGPNLKINHILTNLGTVPIDLAPWAITMVPLGGMALLPISINGNHDLQPNQHLAIWPYSLLSDPRLQFVNSFLVVHGRAGGRCKIGYANHSGWMAYWQPGTVFVKQAEFNPGRMYPDLNSSSECFVNEHFLELETLGPLGELQPGESISHQERWSLLKGPLELSTDEESIMQLAAEIGHELAIGGG